MTSRFLGRGCRAASFEGRSLVSAEVMRTIKVLMSFSASRLAAETSIDIANKSRKCAHNLESGAHNLKVYVQAGQRARSLRGEDVPWRFTSGLAPARSLLVIGWSRHKEATMKDNNKTGEKPGRTEIVFILDGSGSMGTSPGMPRSPRSSSPTTPACSMTGWTSARFPS